ncbi:MAG TPA: TraR/DksA C4-type zinc finger protein [Streptosporangiaceae bacterium]|nr:TraR/DksA C4-type zinc finger protein [Streptosporangiaceae bacterium]
MGGEETPAGLLAAERTRTVERIAGLERELAGIIESASSGADDEHDPEGATLAFERQHLAALLSQASQQLAQVDAAIGRITDGSYGQCVNCGEPIGPARLAARPATTTCIRCA